MNRAPLIDRLAGWLLRLSPRLGQFGRYEPDPEWRPPPRPPLIEVLRHQRTRRVSVIEFVRGGVGSYTTADVEPASYEWEEFVADPVALLLPHLRERPPLAEGEGGPPREAVGKLFRSRSHDRVNISLVAADRLELQPMHVKGGGAGISVGERREIRLPCSPEELLEALGTAFRESRVRPVGF